MSVNMNKCLIAAALALAPLSAASAAPPVEAKLERGAASELVVNWKGVGPVDVLVAERADASPSAARLVSAKDRDGSATFTTSSTHPYVLLRDPASGRFVRVAERLLPLETASNFRDIGGYAAAGGKHVKWGLVYRSGGTPLLSDADKARIASLGLKDMIDLRSSEERVLAPTRVEGLRYSAIGYSMTNLQFAGGMEAGYRQLPQALAAQLKLVFDTMLRAEGPLVYNCSAGQDRTGFVTAMVLSSLGTSRDQILADYRLSTTYRKPENEMPPIDPAVAASNPVAAMFASYQRVPGQRPSPLVTKEGRDFLSFAFDAIEAKWGSVDNYLQQEIGLKPADIAKLRKTYTE
jgi:protein-tyrosine phosphatase